jgi:hypothetical protein
MPLAPLRNAALAAAVSVVLTCAGQPAAAGVITETSQAKFFSDLGGQPVQTETYEGAPSGTVLSNPGTLHGITYTFNPVNAGDRLMVDSSATNGFVTTSGTHFLGTNVGGNFDQIEAGDTIDLAFAQSSAVGLYFVTGDTLLAGDIRLVTPLGTATNSATPDQLLAGGTKAYYVGLVSQGSGLFSGASVQYGPGTTGAFFYNADDLSIASVPEPGSLVLVLTALAAAGATDAARRFRARRAGPPPVSLDPT